MSAGSVLHGDIACKIANILDDVSLFMFGRVSRQIRKDTKTTTTQRFMNKGVPNICNYAVNHCESNDSVIKLINEGLIVGHSMDKTFNIAASNNNRMLMIHLRNDKELYSKINFTLIKTDKMQKETKALYYRMCQINKLKNTDPDLDQVLCKMYANDITEAHLNENKSHLTPSILKSVALTGNVILTNKLWQHFDFSLAHNVPYWAAASGNLSLFTYVVTKLNAIDPDSRDSVITDAILPAYKAAIIWQKPCIIKFLITHKFPVNADLIHFVVDNTDKTPVSIECFDLIRQLMKPDKFIDAYALLCNASTIYVINGIIDAYAIKTLNTEVGYDVLCYIAMSSRPNVQDILHELIVKHGAEPDRKLLLSVIYSDKLESLVAIINYVKFDFGLATLLEIDNMRDDMMEKLRQAAKNAGSLKCASYLRSSVFF